MMASRSLLRLLTQSSCGFTKKTYSMEIVSFKNKSFSAFAHNQHVRCKSVNMSTVAATTTSSDTRSSVDLRSFEELLPSLIEGVLSNKKFKELPEGAIWIKKMLNYTVAGGKKNRGMTTVLSYEYLEKPENLTSEKLRLAATMGWCVEMLQAYFLMLDDVMDGSTTRRGAPCWYLQPNVGLSAINDAILVQATYQAILKQHFRSQPYYPDVLQVFNDIIFNTSMGQYLDWVTANRDKGDFSLFTMDRYKAIVKYKTAYYTYLLPVKLALLMANKGSQELQQVDDVCLKIGQFFQIQDDYIDCFSNSTVSGKIGTDIQEGKCTWLAVVALQKCNQKQLETMTNYYGSKDPSHVKKIKDLYAVLEIQKIYYEHEKNSYHEIRREIQSLPKGISQALFVKFLDKIYKRNV